MDDLIRQLKKIYLLLDDTERHALRALDVTPTQVSLLTAVSKTDGLTISALAGQLLCSRGNATRLVQRLSDRGLVAGHGHERDQRLVLVQLTDRGRSLLAEAQRVLDDSAAHLTKRMGSGNVDRMATLSDELISALEQYLAETS